MVLGEDLASWVPRRPIGFVPLEGTLVRLEPLNKNHGDDLFAVSSVDGVDVKFRYLFDEPPASRVEFDHWLEGAISSATVQHFAVLLKSTGRVVGRQAFMRTDCNHGTTEIGSIYWGPDIARTRAATEALFLFARHAFDDMGYRRFEWKCDALNEPSKRAAIRFGFSFEGIFRQHMVVKGKNRDTAWFAMVLNDWVPIRQALEQWLHEDNFGEDQVQRRRLEDVRSDLLRGANPSGNVDETTTAIYKKSDEIL